MKWKESLEKQTTRLCNVEDRNRQLQLSLESTKEELKSMQSQIQSQEQKLISIQLEKEVKQLFMFDVFIEFDFFFFFSASILESFGKIGCRTKIEIGIKSIIDSTIKINLFSFCLEFFFSCIPKVHFVFFFFFIMSTPKPTSVKELAAKVEPPRSASPTQTHSTPM